MPQNVMITGAGKAVGLGFNLVRRYLEAGDTVVATIRKPCPELDELQKQYGERLITPADCSYRFSWLRPATPDNPGVCVSIGYVSITRARDSC